LPASVLEEATAFTTMLSNATQGAAFTAKLPSGLGPGGVVIHHSSMVERVAFQTLLTYDAMTTEKHAGYTRHFDSRGNEVRLPLEQVAAASGP